MIINIGCSLTNKADVRNYADQRAVSVGCVATDLQHVLFPAVVRLEVDDFHGAVAKVLEPITGVRNDQFAILRPADSDGIVGDVADERVVGQACHGVIISRVHEDEIGWCLYEQKAMP